MIQKIRNAWSSLPPAAKTVVVLFVGAATGVIRHVLQNPDACMTATCWKGYVASAVHAGGLAIFAYLMDSPLAKTPTQ
jgi:hypothetical protein